MVNKKAIFSLAALWELVRFFLLYRTLMVLPGIGGPLPANLLLLWFGASQLALSGGIVMMGFFPESYGSYARLLALGKLLGLFPGTLVLLAGLILANISDPLGASRLPASSVLLPAVIVLFDLIFFIFLLSFTTPKQEQSVIRPQEE